MPTKEAIVDTLLPQHVEKPIPVRVISTRAKPRQTPDASQNRNQPATGESNPAAASATPEESVRLSPQLSALARKEQAFRREQQALKADREKFQQQISDAEEYKRLKEKLSAKDFSEAEKLGLNYDEYTKYKIDSAGSEDPTLQKIAALEAKIAELTGKQEEGIENQYEATVSEYKKEITSLVTSNPEFSSIKELKREDAVLQLILDTWEEDDEEMTVEQACKDIEDFLVEQGKSFSSLSKLKPKVDPEQERRLPPPGARGVSTLTNDMQPPDGNTVPTKSLQHLPDEQRYAEARRRALAKRMQQQGPK